MNNLLKISRTIQTKPARSIFGLFRRNRIEPRETITIDKNKGRADPKQSKKEEDNNNEIQISKAEQELIEKRNQYFIELRQEREQYEEERITNKKNIDYANLRSRREFETTINNLDYSKILIQNIDVLPDTIFENFNTFIHYQQSMNAISYTEESIRKVLKGFIMYSDKFMNNDKITLNEYWDFLDLLRESIGFIHEEETMLLQVEFLDVYCVNYPELWVKIDSRIIEFSEKMTPSQIVLMIARCSNQGEGSDKVYDQLERILTNHIHNQSTKENTMIQTSYYNTKHGTEDFFEQIIKQIRHGLEDPLFNDIEVIVRMSLILNDTAKELLEFVTDIYDVMEKKLLANLDQINIEQATLIAHGYGVDRGSKELFNALEALVFKELDSLEITDLKGIMYGFLFTYRISEENTTAILDKASSFAPQQKPIEMAKLYRALYILELERMPLFKEQEHLTLGGQKSVGDQLEPEELYEIALSFNISRDASREFYKVLEFVLRKRLPDIGKNKHLVQKLFEVYSRSALCSPSFIGDIEFYC